MILLRLFPALLAASLPMLPVAEECLPTDEDTDLIQSFNYMADADTNGVEEVSGEKGPVNKQAEATAATEAILFKSVQMAKQMEDGLKVAEKSVAGAGEKAVAGAEGKTQEAIQKAAAKGKQLMDSGISGGAAWLKGIAGKLGPVANVAKNAARNAANQVKGKFHGWAKKGSKTLAAKAEQGKKFVNKQLSTHLGNAKGWWKKATSWGKKAAGNAKGWAKKAAARGKEWGTESANKARNAANKVKGKFHGWAKKGSKTLAAKAEQGKKFMNKQMSTHLGNAKGWWKKATSWGKKATDRAKGWAKKAAARGKELGTESANKARNAADKVKGKFHAAGKAKGWLR